MEEEKMVNQEEKNVTEADESTELECISEDSNKGHFSGLGVGLLLGGSLALAAIAGGKKLARVWKERKTKKNYPVEVETFVDVESEDIDSEATEPENKEPDSKDKETE